MAYIKISDPTIIDLASWHQVINVVNQHSDTIDIISNNLGTNVSTDWNASDLIHTFGTSNQQIVYGKSRSSSTDTTHNTNVYYKVVSFSQTGVAAFSATPIVTATVMTGGTTPGSVSDTNNDVSIIVYNVSATGFSYKLYRSGSTKAISGNVDVNWIAIGPRG